MQDTADCSVNIWKMGDIFGLTRTEQPTIRRMPEEETMGHNPRFNKKDKPFLQTDYCVVVYTPEFGIMENAKDKINIVVENTEEKKNGHSAGSRYDYSPIFRQVFQPPAARPFNTVTLLRGRK